MKKLSKLVTLSPKRHRLSSNLPLLSLKLLNLSRTPIITLRRLLHRLRRRIRQLPLPPVRVSIHQKLQRLLPHILSQKPTIAMQFLLAKDSIRYHLLHPDYLYFRIRELQKNFRLRVVLCHVDVEDVVKPLLEVTKTALLHDCTLLCAWSLEECGRYLETIKVYENKPADIIQGQMDTDYLSRLHHALTTVRHVNKTDVVTLGSTFGSLSHIMDASMDDLARCPGIGERKVKRLYETFHEPFKRVVPHKTANLETPTKTVPVSEAEEGEKDTEDASKCKKKEPELTVKSALSEAFTKYSEKVGAKRKKSQQEKEDCPDIKFLMTDSANG